MNTRIVEILKMSPPKEISVSGWVGLLEEIGL